MKKIGPELLFVLSFLNCSSVSVSDKDIATLRAELYRQPAASGKPILVPLEKIKPGEQCLLQLVVYTKDGLKIEKPNIHDFMLRSPNHSLIYIEKYLDDTLHFTANPDSFYFSDGKKFLLDIRIINNLFENTLLSWEIDWSATCVFDFSGRDGVRQKSNYNLAALFISGMGGQDGENGENALLCHFDVAYYCMTDSEEPHKTKSVVIYERISKKLYFCRIEPELLFLAKGGNGCDGTDAVPGEKAGKDGKGGNGGNGGNGGDIIINLHEKTDLLDFIRAEQQGGKGGAGGKGQGSPDPEDRQGADGIPGTKGRAGKLIINRLTSFAPLFTNAGHPLFKRSRLRY